MLKWAARWGVVVTLLSPILLNPSLVVAQNSKSEAEIIVHRLKGNPIVTPNMGPRIGTNIQGPSLIRVPEWLPNPLGKYYLYFADHKGSYIRLAYADALTGPWTIYDPGTLQLAESHFRTEPATVPDNVQTEIERVHRVASLCHLAMEFGEWERFNCLAA